MPVKEFSKTEIAEVVAKYPRLEIKSLGVLEGEFDLDADYDGSRITDSFRIRIDATNPHSDLIPALYEIGGRTDAIVKKFSIRDPRDLHRNSDNSACVCVKQEERKRFAPGARLLMYVESLAVPYMYGLSHFEKHGKWPWPDFSHGTLGLLEYCGELKQEQTLDEIEKLLASIRKDENWKEYHKQLRKPSPEKLCVCNSRKPFHKCHSRAWLGILQLHGDLRRLNLNLDDVDRRNRLAVSKRM